jgi:hypothetical protein
MRHPEAEEDSPPWMSPLPVTAGEPRRRVRSVTENDDKIFFAKSYTLKRNEMLKAASKDKWYHSMPEI